LAFSDVEAAAKNRAFPLFATQRDRRKKRAEIDDDDDDDDDDDANVEVDALVDIRRADCAHMVDTHDLIAFLFDSKV